MTKEEQSLFGTSSAQVFEIYSALKVIIDEIGTVSYEFKKTSIHCKKNVAFVGIHPKKKFLDVNIVLNRSLEQEISCKTEQVSANRYHNEVRLENKSEIGEIAKFIQESYLLSK